MSTVTGGMADMPYLCLCRWRISVSARNRRALLCLASKQPTHSFSSYTFLEMSSVFRYLTTQQCGDGSDVTVPPAPGPKPHNWLPQRSILIQYNLQLRPTSLTLQFHFLSGGYFRFRRQVCQFYLRYNNTEERFDVKYT